ncbi:AAEL014241-PA [Aedes aegypti]|uniref:AAEL014241-PA n=2 Tax=Aedes aegypti TaxID=7159 RepID=A0A1S4G1Q0_AEDAE|nr:uncharacterized protein LOC5563939 [Aedes aegypti]EAT33483.1 AAEL014241-PA [Aedes aegypti]
MKFFLALVGAFCLFGSLNAQSSTLSTTVNSAISISKTTLTAAIQQLNNTINTADQSVHTSWTQFIQSMVTLYTSYYNRFQNYTTIDLTSLNNTINNMHMMMMENQPIQDWSIGQIFTEVQTSALQVETALNTAVQTMSNSCAPPCANPTKVATCTTKFGPKLTTAPITMDRLTDCLTAELARYSDIGVMMAAQYPKILTSAVNYLKVVDVCDTPVPEVLNNPSQMYGSPSIQCLSTFMQRVSNMPYNYYISDNMRYPQTYLVQQRVMRCAKLAELDIKDRITKVVESFQNCL